ncbi:MAG: hypothetical protein QW343_03545 [Candidatus Norongarragalinales archaeon]
MPMQCPAGRIRDFKQRLHLSLKHPTALGLTRESVGGVLSGLGFSVDFIENRIKLPLPSKLSRSTVAKALRYLRSSRCEALKHLKQANAFKNTLEAAVKQGKLVSGRV